MSLMNKISWCNMGSKRQKRIQRIVIKIGTSSLTHSTGKLNHRHIREMMDVVCDLKNIGNEIVLVSSGAIGVGLGKIDLQKKPEETAKRRALAAIGQSSLMSIYEEIFNVYDCRVAQVLLTKSALQDKANDISNAFSMMFEYKVLPIVNENDVVAADAIGSEDLFGDNDTLSACVAELIKADLLIIWSDIDGLYNKDPRVNADAQIVPLVTDVNDDIYKMAGGAGTLRGRGGMLTKLNAASIVMKAGINMIITNSIRPQDLYEIMEGKEIGTLFKSGV
jgi:glutamate 5-kinase